MSSEVILDTVLGVLEEKKALDVKTIPLENVSSLADYFIVCTGTSSIHIKALSDSIGKTLKDMQKPVKKVEGYHTAQWILMDYGDVVVNIFDPEQREYYSLERLWAQVKES